MTQSQTGQPDPGKEHVLVCLSSSPSNARIVETAAKMAKAYQAEFTALYVRSPAADRMTAENRKRLEYHMELARCLGAAITTVSGSEISTQIAEYARVSGVTKLVLGRSPVSRIGPFHKPSLMDEIITLVPNTDVFIIPDAAAQAKQRLKTNLLRGRLLPSAVDLMLTLLILAAATGIGMLFQRLGLTEANIITVYILGVLLTALFTKSYGCSLIGSLASVLVFNFFFTEPRLSLHAYGADYPVTFAIMFAASLLIGALANQLKSHAKESARSAFRTQVLFDTEQLLQKQRDEQTMAELTAGQLLKLLDREVVLYQAENGALDGGKLFSKTPGDDEAPYFSQTERQAADRTFALGDCAGAGTAVCPEARCRYYAISIRNRVFGVVGVDVRERPLEAYESSILLSILGECALAMENCKNDREREQAAVLARNEQLRADLLRSISHDLRTPLTSISGSADTLLNSGDHLDEENRKQLYHDIYDDSVWLINLVENLLAVTRIEDGKMQLQMSMELISDVLEEAVCRMGRRLEGRAVNLELPEELLLAKMDVRLMVQVLVNLLDNAVKYTPVGTPITVSAVRDGDEAVIRVADLGKGVPDEDKARIFEPFFIGSRGLADSRRSLGLGLALCRSVIRAHGGEITITDNVPHGSVFSFRLPCEEVTLHDE